MYKLELTLHSLPKSLNKALRAGRWKNNRSNQIWDLMMAAQCRDKLPVTPLLKARISIVRHSFRTLDYDGLVGSLKPVVDGLVSCGVLSDDGWNVLGAWQVDQVFRPKKLGPILTISVEEISGSLDAV